MNNWIVLPRGSNVRWENIAPMQQLADILVGFDCQNVQTYI
jgi:hypothetical protein